MSTSDVIDAGELFRRHARFVAGFVRRMGAHAEDVDDLVQEVFMVTHAKGGYRVGPAKPTSYLAEIALRLLANRRRRRARSREHNDSLQIARAATGSATASDVLEARHSLERVQSALDMLDVDRRAVFILFELEGESCGSIAAGLGIPVGTVYSRLHKARAEFASAHAGLLSRELLRPEPLHARSAT